MPSLWPFRKVCTTVISKLPLVMSCLQTRTGRSYSEWDGELGPPIQAPADFDLKTRLAECVAAQKAYLHADPADLVSAEAPAATPNGEGCSQPLTPPTPPSPPAYLPSLSSTPSATTVPDVTPTCPYPPAYSPEEKKKFHSAKHGRDRRQRRAAQDLLRGGADKPLTPSGIKRLQNAVEVVTHRGKASRTSGGIADTMHAQAVEDGFSLDMKKLPVAASAFVGINYEQTLEDRKPISVEALRAAHPEFQYIAASEGYVPCLRSKVATRIS